MTTKATMSLDQNMRRSTTRIMKMRNSTTERKILLKILRIRYMTGKTDWDCGKKKRCASKREKMK